MTPPGHLFDIESRRIPLTGEYVVTIALHKPGLKPSRAVAVRDECERTAYSNAVMAMIDDLKGYRTLQRKLITEAIRWL